MNEEIIKTEWSFNKEVERYTDNIDNYQIPNEIMVTITLNEYRRLLTAAADARAKEAEENKYKREEKIRELEEKLKSAEEKIEMLLCDRCAEKKEEGETR